MDEQQTAGRHSKTISLDGLAAGMYYYRLQTSNEELGGQMVVTK